MNYQISDIQRFCLHDGAGIRTTVFLSGCPLTCRWCHNPETCNEAPLFYYNEEACLHCGACAIVCKSGAHCFIDSEHRLRRELCSHCGSCLSVCPCNAVTPTTQMMTADEILQAVLRDRTYYGENQGGVTLSGGEPLWHFEEALALLRLFKAHQLNTCVETSGAFAADTDGIAALTSLCDHILFDIKDTDAIRLAEHTGAHLPDILDKLRALDQSGGRTTLRVILLKSINCSKKHALSIAELYHSLTFCDYIELLPYHPFGNAKAKQLGLSVNAHAEWQIEAADIEEFAGCLTEQDVPVKYHGDLHK